MKRSKRLLVLGGILAVTCIATLILSHYEEKQEEIKNSDEVILEVASEDVTNVSWDYNGTEFSFSKKEDAWSYDADDAFPVSEEQLQTLLSHFESFGVSFVINEVDDYSQYGLKKPEYTISLTTTEKTYEIKLGDYSQMDSQRYVDIGDGNVYLVSEDPVEYLPSELASLIKNDEVPNLETVSEIQFAGNQNYTITYNKDKNQTYSEDDVYFTEIDGKTVALDPDTVSSYLSTISALTLNNYSTYNATDKELEEFGLDDPELSVTVNYSYTDEDEEEVFDTCLLQIGQNQDEKAATEKAQEKDKDEIPEVTKYVRIGDSSIVYVLSDDDYEALRDASCGNMRHKKIFWADFDALVTKIDLTLEGETHTLTSTLDEKEEDAERVWSYDDEEFDIYDLKNAILALEKSSFTDADVDDAKEEIRLTLYLEHKTFPKVTIDLYRQNGSVCLAVVDGESTAFVPRSTVVDLIEAAQAIVLD